MTNFKVVVSAGEGKDSEEILKMFLSEEEFKGIIKKMRELRQERLDLIQNPGVKNLISDVNKKELKRV